MLQKNLNPQLRLSLYVHLKYVSTEIGILISGKSGYSDDVRKDLASDIIAICSAFTKNYSINLYDFAISGYDNHNMPPSKVIHCRAVADGCKETDLVQVMKPFGGIR